MIAGLLNRVTTLRWVSSKEDMGILLISKIIELARSD